MEQNNTISLIASNNITPSTFVVYDPSNSYQALQATGASVPFAGIAQKFSDTQGGIATSIGAAEPNLASIPGEGLEVFILGGVCRITVGSGGCIPGQLLTSDANGNAIVATTGNYVGAQAQSLGIAGDLVDVVVVFGKI